MSHSDFPPRDRTIEGFLQDTSERIDRQARRRFRVATATESVAGIIAPYGGTVLPTGWLLCDGSAVSRSLYPELFAAIGTTYGAGDGSTTFNLPNYKGRTPFGRDAAQAEFDVLGETGGSKAHVHSVAGAAWAKINWESGGKVWLDRGVATSWTPDVQTTASPAPLTAGSTATTGGVELVGDTQSGSTLPPYIVTNWMISTGSTAGGIPGGTDPLTATILRLTSTGDVTLAGSTHALQIGADSSVNLAVDNNEIQARNNGAASGLNLNVDGGPIQIGSSFAPNVETVYGWLVQAHLPEPVHMTRGADTNAVTATTAWGQTIGGMTANIDIGRAMWVQIDFGAWMTCLGAGNDIRVGIELSGATVLSPPTGPGGQADWGQSTLYANTLTAPSGSTLSGSARKTVKLNPGITTFTMKAYRLNTAGATSVNYPSCTISPQRYV
jgi:microcystin-dependent protein